MDQSVWVQLLGYGGCFILVGSFLLPGACWLRIVSAAGCLMTIVYTLMVKDYPMALLMVFVLGANLMYMRRPVSKSYQIVWTRPEDPSVQYYLEEYGKDMERIWGRPDLTLANSAAILYSKSSPASILILNEGPDHGDVLVDYAFPDFRDLSAGTYIYNHLKEHGLKKMTTRLKDEDGYFSQMGFRMVDGLLTKDL